MSTTAGPIRIAILANGRQARSEAALTARAYGVMGRKVGSAGKLIAGAFAIGSLIRVAGAVERVGGAYVGSLNKIQALTGANEKQLDRAADNIERRSGIFAKMGQTAGDAAGGIVELTKSGLSLNASLKAVRATMTLAKAGELEVADASELVANTLNTFSLKAKDASRIANGLANAANISSADVSDLAESFKYVSPLAAKAGVSLDQTNAILAELANSGIKASQAGTSFRSFLLSLQAPVPAAADALKKLNVSVYDAQGNMRPLSSLIDQLSGSLGKLNQEDQNVALKTIFGKVGITGAQVILKNGTKVLDQYTKGVKRAGAAQKLANAASKGLDGTLQSLKASTVSTTQELFRRFSPALDARLSSLADYLAANKDQMIETGVAAARRLGPALSTLASLAKSAATALKDTAVPLAKDLLPAIESLAKLALGAADAVNELPGPVKAIGVQAAIAALILPRLTAGVTSVTSSLTLNIARLQQWRAEMTYGVTRAQQTAVMMQRLGAAAKTAAGIGGMVALTQAAGETNKKLKAVELAAGGAAVGFAVGGPLGAAIGGISGGLLGIVSAVKDVNQGWEEATPKAKDYASTLNEITGAATRATRAMVLQGLQEQGLVQSANVLGISTRDMIDAALGNANAASRIGEAWKKTGTVLDGLQNQKISNWLAEQGYQIRQNQAEVRNNRDALKSWDTALKGVRPNVRVKLETLGYELTRKQFRALDKQADLTARERKIILREIGIEPTRRKLKQLGFDLGKVGKAKPNLDPFVGSMLNGLSKAGRRAVFGTADINKILRQTTAKAKPDLTPFQRQLVNDLQATQTPAHTGGARVGSELKAGALAGVGGLAALLSGQVAGAVNAAIAAGRRAADSHSPSRKMAKLGNDLGDGLVLGMAARKKQANDAGRNLIRSVLRGVDKGSEGIGNVLDRITKLIEKKLDGKKQAGRRKALLKSLKDERAELVANGKLQDKNAKRLDQATAKLKSRTKAAKEYAATIKAAAVSYGSVVGLGTTGGGTAVSLSALLSQLGARAGAVDKYNALIEKLSKGPKGLNQTTVQQLLDAGVEGGLATAEAIASGGQAAINQINQLTAHIASSGGKLGQEMRDRYKQAGIDAAQGMVDGLKKRQKALDKVAERLANALVSRVKKALGIHSPSKVFADIGRRSVQGLGIGLDETYVRRVGTRTAAALTTGFGTPALDAYMRQSSSGSSAPTFTVQIELTAQQLSEVEKGRKIQVSLDAYKSAGGRSRVKTS